MDFFWQFRQDIPTSSCLSRKPIRHLQTTAHQNACCYGKSHNSSERINPRTVTVI